MGPGHWLALAWLLGGMGLGAFIVYAVVAAWARDWKTCEAYLVTLASLLAVGWVAIAFNT